MQIKLIQTFFILSLVIVGWALHLQQQTTKIYDPQKYYSELNVTQEKVKADLLVIQNQFKKLDQDLIKASDDPNQQLRLYQEGIADERDSLYKIQQYLNLPFNQRACKCFDFSDSLRAKLLDQLAKTKQALDKLKQQAQKCVNCQIDTEIEYQIKQQQAYIKIMEDTMNAKCCKVYKFIYSDNLNASNWLYGSLSQQNYKKWMNDQLKKYNTQSSIQKTCPIFTPYAIENLDKCIQCSKDTQIFNLQTRKCQQCPSKKAFNPDTHKCQFNVTCPAGKKYDEITNECEKIQPAFNSSRCPPQTPIWNSQLRGCFQCSPQTPYFDRNTQKCIACPDSYIYNSNTNQCYHKSCQPDQIYNQKLKQCFPSQSKTPGTSSNSLCPSTKPYWDKSSLSCTQCPVNQPFYNTTSKACQSCPSDTKYDQSKNLCFKQCQSGFQLNPITLQCQKIVTVPHPQGSDVSICPPTRPNWNTVTKSCEKCPIELPNWNSQTKVCQKCVMGQTLNNITNICQGKATVQLECPPGTILNQKTQMCDKSSGTITHCPQDKPFYNAIIMACSSCPPNKPLYNSKTNQCKQNPASPLPQPQPQPSSPTSTSLSGQIIFQCVPPKVWDQVKKECVTSQQNATTSVSTDTSGTNSRCPIGQVFIQDKLRCECPQGLNYKYNADKKVCEQFCGKNQQYIDGNCKNIV